MQQRDKKSDWWRRDEVEAARAVDKESNSHKRDVDSGQ